MKSRFKHMILNQVPTQCCEGPFWGNGMMGTVLYFSENVLRLTLDHASLWEMRETLPDVPKATFREILNNKEAYLSGDPDYIADTNIFDHAVGRTKLPSLAVSIPLPCPVVGFESDTDLQTASTQIFMNLEDGTTLSGMVYLNSCQNLLCVSLNGAHAHQLGLNAEGWNLELEALKPLKNWGYSRCSQDESNGIFLMGQQFSGTRIAVVSAAQEYHDDTYTLTATIDIGGLPERKRLETKGEERLRKFSSQQEALWNSHKNDWAAFWSGFDLTVPKGRLQRAFYQELYKLYCNERPGASPVTLQGVWNPDNRMPAWFGDLHNDLNVQCCYWPAFKTGNFELARPYIDYYHAAIPRFRERAEKLFGIKDAIHLPVMMTPEGTGAASEWCYWNTLLGPELFAAVDFCWFFEYSQDTDTLKEKIYPFLCGVLNLYLGIAEKREDGYLHIPFTQSPEVDTEQGMLMLDDSTFVLSSLHYLADKVTVYSGLIGENCDKYAEFGRKLVPVPVTDKGYPLFPNRDVFHSHRHFCQMYPIFPLCQDAHSETAERSLDAVINLGFLEYAAFSFPYMAVMAARCGRGNMSRTMLELYCMVFRSRNSFTVNGDPYQNGVLKICDTNAGEPADSFTLESGFFVPAALCEMFVHRAADRIWLLKGIPDDWKDCSCDRLTTEGGHHFSITRSEYRFTGAAIIPKKEEQIKLSIHGISGVLNFSIGTKAFTPIQEDGFFLLDLKPGEEIIISCS